MNKKGLELSINFIVVIIIALVVFFFGLRFLYQLGSEASKLQTMTVDELDRKIESLACEGSEKVCFGFDTKTIKRGNFGVFGLRIINILDDQNFDIIITKGSPSGYTKNNEPIPTNNIKLKHRPSVFIKQNEEQNLGIGVEVPKNAQSGKYIFDVKVEPYSISDNTLYKIYVDVP